MKLLVYADLQATDGADLCFGQPDTTLQHYRVAKFFDDITTIYTEYRCDGVVDLGDTTDDRSAIPMPTLDSLCAGLAKLPPSKKRWKLTGNHEQFLKNTSIDNRRLFEPYFHVISNRKIFDFGRYRAYFCAYPQSYADLASWIKAEAAKHRGPKILFGHFQVKGAYMNQGQAASGIPQNVLSGFDLVLLGHIHQPQSLTDRIIYVGSPFQQNWGEANQRKRVIILDTQTLEMTEVAMQGYPEYRELTWAEFKAEAGTTSEHRYRVTLNSHEETEAFFAHPAFGRAVGVYNYDVEKDDSDAIKQQDWSFDGSLRRYAELVAPPADTGVDLDELVQLGKILGGVS